MRLQIGAQSCQVDSDIHRHISLRPVVFGEVADRNRRKHKCLVPSAGKKFFEILFIAGFGRRFIDFYKRCS